MRYYLVAGEASGDMHAANLMEQIKKQDPDAQFRFWGGDRMKKQGGKLVKHYQNHAFMGFVEVAFNLKTIIKNLKTCKQDIMEYKPHLLILVDYPGFNLRIAAFAKAHKIKTAYYISPQIWAWNESRAKNIRKTVDKMFVILPFEKAFYAKHAIETSFVGHPLLDELEKTKNTIDIKEFKKNNTLDNRPVVALLPGSRKQEVKRMLPVMASVSQRFPKYQFVVAATATIPTQMYDQILQNTPVKRVSDQTYPLLQTAVAGIITSGTASMEAALFHVPQVVVYKASRLSYIIAKQLIKLRYISVVNLIFHRHVFKELIQKDCNPENVSAELERLINNSEYRQAMIDYYHRLETKLGGAGASQRAAREMTEMAKK